MFFGLKDFSRAVILDRRGDYRPLNKEVGLAASRWRARFLRKPGKIMMIQDKVHVLPFRVQFIFKLIPLAASLLLVFTASFADTIDHRLYRFLHDSYRSRGMDAVMEAATFLGNKETGLGVCLVFFTYGSRYERETAKLAFTSLAITGAVTAGLKYTVNRRRPEGSHSRLNSSFPSGHAAGAFAMATVLSSRYPEYRLFFYPLASLIALSRVYLGRHYPSDVVAGGLLGYIGSKILLRFEKGILELEF